MVGILSRDMHAVFVPVTQSPTSDDPYATLDPVFADCDLVIVEGDSQTNAPKIEVWRAALGSAPIAAQDNRVLAVTTDDPIDIDVDVHARSDVASLAAWILDQALRIT